jgi:hypothetical protein
MYVSLSTFLLLWFIYYFLIRSNEKANIGYVMIFCGTIILSQLSCNSFEIFQKCQGNNFADVLTVTLIPWIFVFSFVILLLVAGPEYISEGLKSPFANVVGYFYVVDKANTLLNEILVDPSVSKSLRQENNTVEAKNNLESTSQAILKIMGNNAILINEITPGTFENYWKILTPLMKEDLKENPAKKSDLLKLVYQRDIVGEAVWALYTGILCVAISDYQINTLKCSKTLSQMQQQFSEYLDEKKLISQMK